MFPGSWNYNKQDENTGPNCITYNNNNSLSKKNFDKSMIILKSFSFMKNTCF